MNLLDGAFDFCLLRGLGLGQQDFGEQGALGGILDYFHWVFGTSSGQCLKRCKRAKMLKE